MVLTNIEDKYKIFEGGPYFFTVARLYMRPWVMNFVPEKETFTSVPVWVRLYSLPLDYWQNESLMAIGNKLGCFVKASKATRSGKYTFFARICVEMDLLGTLPEEIILNVFDEEWVQIVDYEHIPFICRKFHEHGHLFTDCPLKKEMNKRKSTIVKEVESFQKVVNRSKGSKRGTRNQQREEQQLRQNNFQGLQEEEENTKEEQAMEGSFAEKEEGKYPVQTENDDYQKEATMSD